MHAAIVWATAFAIGVVCALTSQSIAPMSSYGRVLFVGMISCVAAYGLFPSLKLRRLSIRWRDALRRSMIPKASSLRTQPMAHAQRLLIATAACSAAVIAYQTMARPVSAGMENTAPMAHAHFVTARDWDLLGHLARHPALGSTTTLPAAVVDQTVQEPTPLQPSKDDNPRPGWVRLIELLFAPSQPAA